MRTQAFIMVLPFGKRFIVRCINGKLYSKNGREYDSLFLGLHGIMLKPIIPSLRFTAYNKTI